MAQLLPHPPTLDPEILAALVEGSTSPLYAIAPDGTLLSWNDGAAGLYGVPAQQALGRSWYDLVMSVEQRETARAMVKETVETGSAILEVDRRRKDGTLVQALVLMRKGNRLGDRAPYLTVHEIDMSEHRRLERELFDKIWSLDEAKAELARSNQDLQQFAYVASHDLQEPLRMVSSFVQLLARRYRGRLDQDADEFIGFVVDGATRMQTLIDDLLAFSRVNTQAQPPQPTDAEAVLRRVLSSLQVAIRDSGGTVTFDPLPTVVVDAVQLGQVFQNLVANALKFRGPQPSRVHVTAVKDGSSWRFSVRDNGIGIDLRQAGRLFQLFQRMHDRSEYPGTGLGLAICKRIVERHGGTIWIESELGHGATFHFTIAAPKEMKP